jgi:HEPN/Toprim N-terminal domain 1
MGSMINLAIGRLEIEWGKNNGFADHSALFQWGDLTPIPYYYAGAEKPTVAGEPDWEVITIMKDGLSKPLAQVVDRINLLGHTAAVCEKEFTSLSAFHEFDVQAFSFRTLQQALAAVDVNRMSPNYGEGGEDFGKFFRREIFPRLGLGSTVTDRGTQFDAAYAMENLSAYSILHLLAENPTARDLDVQWAFNDVEEGGWAKRSDFVRPLDQNSRFLIVTEGSSDALIIGKAFRLLKPHISDFFDFVDMQEGYPFSGTGNVFRFVQGLISIHVLNNVLIVYDNDAEGVANFERTCALNLPANMRAVTRFPTVGPNGRHEANINGRAAAIESYLHLRSDACVRWSSYNDKVRAYQGELIGKEYYTREFLDQRNKDPLYDYTNIGVVLHLIVKSAIAMREALTLAHYIDNYEQRLMSS